MKIRHNTDNPLPRKLYLGACGDKIHTEFDVRVTPRARMSLKVLVFRNSRDLCGYWRKVLKRPLGGSITKGNTAYNVYGAVSALYAEITSFRDPKKEKHWMEVDPHYFAVMGLVIGRLGMEIITHESVHAAIAYSRRHTNTFWVDAGLLDEENICYPAGRIAAVINRKLHDLNLYEG